MGMTGAALALDTATTVPLLRDPRQALKLSRLWVPVLVKNVRRPGGLVGAAVSILRSGPTQWMLERLAEEHVPVVVVHGDRDVAVPLRTGEDAARRARGELVVVHGATHAWPLKDPETLPAIVSELLAEGTLGRAVGAAVRSVGLDPERAALTDVEAAFCAPGALLPTLDPDAGAEATPSRHPRRPRYEWT